MRLCLFILVTLSCCLQSIKCTSNMVFSVQSSEKIKPVSMPALGRPFSLGDLYDRTHDVIIQGPKLWSHDQTEQYSQVKTHGTRFEVSSSENVVEKMNKLDISASLKASFVSGMVEVSGSAAYLKDQKKKNNQARVSLKYESTVYKRSLLPELFTKVTYPQVLEKVTSATDVVVAIQYGAGAIFVFDKDLQEDESRSDIEGYLEIAVRNIPSFGIEGSGKVKIREEQRKKMERFSCKFHGDFVLKDHPGNYEEAIRVYKALPDMLGEAHQNAVPVKVWLYPIDKLPLTSQSVKLHNLEQSLMTDVTKKVEELEDFIRQCNDIIDTQVASNHERIKRNVMGIKHKIQEYIIVFKEKLFELVPKIRQGSALSSALTKLFEDKEKSPFNKVQLQRLISHYAEEVNVLSSIQDLPHYCRDDGEFSAQLINNKQYMVGLVLQLGKHDDEYLNAMEKFMTSRSNEQLPDLTERYKWWNTGSSILRELQRLTYVLETYHNIEEQKTKLGLQTSIHFYVREQMIEAGKPTAVFMELYENGKLKEAKFDIPGEAGKPTARSLKHNEITIQWPKPTISPDRVKSYLVSAYVQNNTASHSPCNFQFCLIDELLTIQNSATIENLHSETEYFFQISTNGEFSKTAVGLMTDGIVTGSCPPGTILTNRNCNACPPGSYSDKANSYSCKKCPLGTYSNQYASSSCIQCPAGFYNDFTGGATSCKKCPGGTYSQRTGGKSISDCSKCPLGTYNPHPAKTTSSSCMSCSMGTYNPNPGEQQCYFCPFGTGSKISGAVTSKSCVMNGASQAEITKAVNEVKGLVQNNLNIIRQTSQKNKNDLNKLKSAVGNFNQDADKIVKDNMKVIYRQVSEQIGSSYRCTEWTRGDGKGSREFFVGRARSKQDCISRCLAKKKDVPKMNGVTVHPVDFRCWCEENQSSIGSTRQIQNCKLFS